jgi:hypothetical protein
LFLVLQKSNLKRISHFTKVSFWGHQTIIVNYNTCIIIFLINYNTCIILFVSNTCLFVIYIYIYISNLKRISHFTKVSFWGHQTIIVNYNTCIIIFLINYNTCIILFVSNTCLFVIYIYIY